MASGHVHPASIAWLTVALALSALAFVAPRLPRLEAQGDLPLRAILGIGLAVQLAQLATNAPGTALRPDAATWPFQCGLGAAALLVVLQLLAPRPPRALFALLLGVHFLLGAWLIRAVPEPRIDVFVIHRGSLDGLLAGLNPYAMTFPNIYDSTVMYGPGQVENGRLTFGYCYPPLTLLWALPGHLLGGDYRHSFLAAITLTGAAIAWARPGRTAPLAAALLLFTPRVFYVVEHGWTDPVVLMLLAATVLCAVRAPRLLPIAAGLLLAAKQYTFLLVVPLALLVPRQRRWRLLATAVAVAAGVTAPLALWSPRAFLWCCLTLQFHSPFRADAMSYLAWIARGSGPRWPAWVGFATALPSTGLAILRGERTPAGFAGGAALILLAFFAFNKQAFSNYYFLVIGALAAAVGAGLPRERLSDD